MPEILTLRHFIMTAAQRQPQFRPVRCVQYGYKPPQDEVEWDFYFFSFEIFGHMDASLEKSTHREVVEKPEIYPKQVFLPPYLSRGKVVRDRVTDGDPVHRQCVHILVHRNNSQGT